MIAPLLGSITRPLLSPLVSGLRDELFGAFTPRSLFNDGSIGVLYDNNDFVNPTTWRRNLFTYTEDFSNAAWSKANNVQVTANAGIAPDGTNTAWKLSSSISTNGIHDMRFTVPVSPSNTKLTHSIYVKADDYASVGFISFGSNTTDNTVFSGTAFNLTTGAQVGPITHPGGGRTYNCVNAGNGWWRIDFTSSGAASSATTISFVLALIPDVGNQFQTLSIGQGILIWHPQIEVGTAPTDYQRITDFNSDFLAAYPNTTLYEDAAGTIPARVNGLVGLQLDKSQGLVLGAELVTNGDFSGGTTGWAPAGGTSQSVVDGKLRLQASGVSGGSFQDILLSGQRFAEISATIRRVSGSSGLLFSVWSYGSFATNRFTVGSITSTGDFVTYTGKVQADASGFRVYLQCPSGDGVFEIDNITIKELPGNHRYQTTTGSKPILRGTPTGGNLVANPTFATDTWWGKDPGIAITGGKAVFTTTTNFFTLYTPASTISTGNVYRVRFTIDSISAGGIRVDVGSAVSATYTSAGTYEVYLTASGAGTQMSLRAIGTTTATIDNVELFDVSAGSVTAPYGLQYDGVDDFLQTASVNFSATDKMFVCAGVRKLSDAALGVIVELSTSAFSNNGSFALGAPSSSAVPDYVYASKGTTAVVSAVSTLSFAAPITNVVSGVSEIASDTCIVRVNGVQSGLVASDQGTGNYGNYAFYFGRRAGTSSPLNGFDFGFCIVGKTLTAAQIASTERWMAQRTGVSI